MTSQFEQQQLVVSLCVRKANTTYKFITEMNE